MIATGLGGAAAQAKRAQPKLEVLEQPEFVRRTGTDDSALQVEEIDYDKLEQPAVVRRRNPPATPRAATGFDTSNIPAFLRAQND
jgi:hypothetical protein